jgi:hypothetical protein
MAYVVTTETTQSDGAVNNLDVSMPTGHQAGDMTVLFITQDGGGTNILNPGGEFTLQGTQASNQGQRTVVYTRLHTGSGEADVNFTGSTEEWIVSATLVRGATTLSIDGYNKTDSANSTSNSLTSGTVTTTVDRNLVLVGFGFDGTGRLTLNNTGRNTTVNLSKETSTCVQIVQYFNQVTAGTTPAITALSELQSEGGSALVIAIREATPASAPLSPMITQSYETLRYYGGATSASTNTAAFIRHDSVTWVDANGNITPSAINGISLATIATFTEGGYSSANSPWGVLSNLVYTGSAIDATGRWYGHIDSTFPTTDMTGKIVSVEFGTGNVTTSRFGVQGMLIYFEDSSGDWAAFQLSQRQGLLANVSYVFFVDVEQATPYASGGTIDWSDISIVGYLIHKVTTTTSAVEIRLKNLLLLNKVVLVDGSAESPCSPTFLQQVLGGLDPLTTGGHGTFIVATNQGKGQALARYGVQYGNGSRATYTDLSASSHELPLRANPSRDRRFWKVEDNTPAGEYRVYASAGDSFSATACVISTDVRQNFVIDSSSSSSAGYDFSGASIVGYDIIHNVSGIVINDATLRNCQVTLNGGLLDGCVIVSPFDRILTNDPSKITDCDFTSAGSGHAIEITATGTFTFTGNNFTGYGADGSTDAVIYNNSGGHVTLNVSGGAVTVRNGTGATTDVVAGLTTITLTGLKEDSEVRVYENDGGNNGDEIDGVEDSGTSFSFSASSASVVNIMINHLNYLPADIWQYTVPSSDATIPIVQFVDRQYNNPA